jgi:DnaJ-class molecular chaperone
MNNYQQAKAKLEAAMCKVCQGDGLEPDTTGTYKCQACQGTGLNILPGGKPRKVKKPGFSFR